MGVTAPASPNSTFYCGNIDIPFNLAVGGFLICVALLLISGGLLILVTVLPPDWVFTVHKCMTYTLIAIITVLVVVVCLFVIAVVAFFIFTAVVVFANFSLIGGYHCNSGLLVMYYWAFTEIVIIASLIVLVIIVANVALFLLLFIHAIAP